MPRSERAMRAQMRTMPCRSLSASFMAATLALLIGLGIWQLQRLDWKEGLIAKIEARTKAPPISLDEAVKRARAGDDVSYLARPRRRQLRSRQGAHLYALSDGEAGWHVITPLATGTGDSSWSTAASSRRQERSGGAARRVRSPDLSTIVGLRACRKRRAASTRTTKPPQIAGSGAIFDAMIAATGFRQKSRRGAVPVRGRARRGAWRLAARRRDAAGHPERPPAIRAHLVPDGVLPRASSTAFTSAAGCARRATQSGCGEGPGS